MMKWILIILFVTGLGLVLGGCSHHDRHPATPVVIDTTPTYRSTTRSTDLHVEPFYTQPGINSGPPAPLPRIPSHDRWDPNDPLATGVYNALAHDNKIQPKFLRVYAHNGDLWLQGSVSGPDQISDALAIAKSTKGVRSVRNDLHVSQ